MGKYVLELGKMLLDEFGNHPKDLVAGVNGGYDYRVDLWKNYVPEDNICYARYLSLLDSKQFYHHPAPKYCKSID